MSNQGLVERVGASEKTMAEGYSQLSQRLDRHAVRLQSIEEILGTAQPPGPEDTILIPGAAILADTTGPRLDRIENTLAELAGNIGRLAQVLSTPDKFELASAGPDLAAAAGSDASATKEQPASPPATASRRGRGRPHGSKTAKATKSRSRRAS